MTTPSTAGLLDPGFVRELEVLRRRLEVRARSGMAGERLAKRRGGSAEFHEHRNYTAGDDLRRIDWAAYARSGEPVVKVFRAEEDVIARLLCDASASLGMGEPSKILVARRIAAAIAYMTLADAERAQVVVTAGGAIREHKPSRGRGGLGSVLRSLEAIRTGGTTDLASAIDTIVRRSGRPGMLVVLSDFFDPGGVLGALTRASTAGHDVVLCQILTPDEVHPSGEGDWQLEDIETGERIDLTLDATAIDAYAKCFAGLCHQLRSWARRHGCSYVRVRTDEALEEAVRRMVSRSID